MKNFIGDSPTLPTQSMDGNLDQQYIIIDVTPAITLILEGRLHQHHWYARCNFTKKLISDSPMIPTQSMDGNLDQQYIIIDVTPAITMILEGKLHQI